MTGATNRGATRDAARGGSPASQRSVSLDPPAMRQLDWHEARAHAIGGRLARDLGDAILVHDPHDRDPFWNRLSGLRLPADPNAFDARLAELLSLFVGLDRRPHVWAAPAHDQPDDLVARLRGHGFDDVGGGLLMVLADPVSLAIARTAEPVTIDVLHRPPDRGRWPVASEVAGLLVAAFRVDPLVRPRLAQDIVAAFDSPELRLYVVRVGTVAVAAAKRTSFEGASYLSSIATRPGWQSRGLGSWLTAMTCRDAIADGDATVYLRVFPENTRARSVYERLGFATAAGRAADLLLGWA